ncbi:hypothetical protein [Bradyrhizobium sp. 188]|uniref:hypothetical protein n=1 Tax=Bradyrhizobium sp. 188 TaxID=2782656 RepID=UPI001FF78586|nr:hypothetical protein [Bradyrhizobium sp. 188]
MLDAIETYLALRRTTGFAMSTAEYLLKSFAAFAAERGQTYVETKQPSTGPRSDHPSRIAMHGSELSVASYAMSGWRTSGTSCRRQITSAPARSVARRTSTRQTRSVGWSKLRCGFGRCAACARTRAYFGDGERRFQAIVSSCFARW